MNRIFFSLASRIVLVSILFICHVVVLGQCAMCKAVVETGKQAGESWVRGFNTGILYLMAIPYVAAIIVGYLMYRYIVKKKQY